MRATQRKLRSLRDLRTFSKRADASALSHRAHMRLACLEMEKARRQIERRSAVERLQGLDARLHDIATEQADIRKTIAGDAGVTADARISSARPNGRKRQFKIKY
jgi:hypothetical protein